MECPRNGNQCSHCLNIAQDIYVDALVAAHPERATADILLEVEQIPIKANLEEQADLGDLSCTTRQERASKVARHLLQSRGYDV